MLRLARHVHARDRHEEPVPGRRRGAQLRRQRPHPARGPVREHLDSAGGRRRGRRARRRRCSSGTSCSTSRATSAAARQPAGLAARARVRRRRDRRRSSTASARPTRASTTTTQLCDDVAEPDRRRQGRRLVPGPHGVRPAGARARAASSATPRNPRMQTVMNVKVKFREGFRPFAPAVLARARRTSTSTCGPSEDSPYMLLVAPVRRDGSAAAAPRTPAARGIDKLQGACGRRCRRSRTSTTPRACRPSIASGTACYHKLIERVLPRRPAAR